MGKALFAAIFAVVVMGLVFADFYSKMIMCGSSSNVVLEGDFITINKDGNIYRIVELFGEKHLVFLDKQRLDVQKVTWFYPRLPAVYIVSAIGEPRVVSSYQGLVPREKARIPEAQAIAKTVWEQLVPPTTEEEKDPVWIIKRKI